MHLKEFSLVSPDIQNGDILKALEMAIPARAIEDAIATTNGNQTAIIDENAARITTFTSPDGQEQPVNQQLFFPHANSFDIILWLEGSEMEDSCTSDCDK